jgi:predicted CXXCH cytochrome family protein
MRRQHLTQHIGTLVVAIALIGLPTVAFAGVENSLHDLSYLTGASAEICVVCHTPHFADTSVTDSPLWNHEVTTATYTLYSSDTLDAIPGQPDGVSKLCLSCHDGTVAIDSFGGATGSITIPAGSNVTTDLRDDHPISFAYTDALAGTDGGLQPPTTTASGLGADIDADMLFGTNVECASCHDVHNALGAPIGEGLLRIANNGSALCLTCHNK